MNKKFTFAVLGYLVPTFLLGFFWHLVWFHNLYSALNIYRPNPLIPLGLGSMVIQGVIFAWLYPRIVNLKESMSRKLAKTFFTFALLSWSFTTLAVAAKHPISDTPKYIVIETLFTLIQFAIVTPLIALAWRNREGSNI